MSREEAIEKLKVKPYAQMNIEEEFEFIANKLDITVEELKNYHEMPLKFYKDYKNSLWLFNFGANVLNKLGVERAIKR